MNGRFSGTNGDRVHHLDGSRNDPGADDVGDRSARFADAVECGEQRLHALRLAQDADDHLGNDSERALAANEQSEEIRPRRVG